MDYDLAHKKNKKSASAYKEGLNTLAVPKLSKGSQSCDLPSNDVTEQSAIDEKSEVWFHEDCIYWAPGVVID